MVLEAALWIPVMVLLIVGMIQFGKITYLYYTLKKTVYAAARYLATQQAVNFCDPADPNIQAAVQFAITDSNTGLPLITNLTANMLQVTTECFDPANPGGPPVPCNVSGCGGVAGGPRPDYVVVSIAPAGYPVEFRIPFISPIPIALRPSVMVPFGGTSL
jgi:hypothetical protein